MRAGKTTMLGVQAPKVAAPSAPSVPSSSAQGADDSWDGEQTRVEDRAALTKPADPRRATLVSSPGPPAVAAETPVAPPALPIAAPPASPVPVPAPAASAPSAGLTAADVRLIVGAIVEDALFPLQRAIAESHLRIAELERRPLSATAKILPETTLGAAGAMPAPYASAIAAPARAVGVVPAAIAPRAPLLDVKGIERDVPIDFDNPFDGRRRRRRLGALLVVALLVIFGGLFALLAESYTPHH